MICHRLHVCAFEKLLSVCPVLQNLAIYDLNWEYWKCSRTLSSPTLVRLTLDRSAFSRFHGSDFGRVTFDTPNLTYLYYSDSYPIVSLDSLVEANLKLVVTINHTWNGRFAAENDPITSNPTNLIKGLRNVEIMNLFTPATLEMFYFFREGIPVFENLFQLSIVTNLHKCCGRGLPFLVNNSHHQGFCAF